MAGREMCGSALWCGQLCKGLVNVDLPVLRDSHSSGIEAELKQCFLEILVVYLDGAHKSELIQQEQ